MIIETTDTIERAEATETRFAIRPFRVDFPQADLDELRRRILATRWPERELVDDATQGVQLALMQKVARLLGDGL